MFKKLIVIYIALASLSYFNFVYLGDSLVKLIELSGIGLMILTIVLSLIYDKGEGFILNFRYHVYAIFIAVFLSMFMAYQGHGQSFKITLVAQRFMYYYLFYFTLHALKIPTRFIIHLIIAISIIHAFFYIVQFFAYPNVLFNVRISEDRGTLRIFLPGFSYIIITYFYSLKKFFEEYKFFYLGILMLFLSIFVLMGTRQVLFTIALLTIAFILLNKEIKSKFLLVTLVLLSFIPVFFIFQDIFMQLFAVTKEQGSQSDDDIRVRSATFFLTTFNPNRFAYIVGNGVSSQNSNYGVLVQSYKDYLGFYQSDVGLIGEYSRFGILIVLTIIATFISVLKSKLGSEYTFLKYLFISMLLTLFTGSSAFGTSDSIVALCFVFYFIDVHKHDQQFKETDEEEETAEEISTEGVP